MDYTVTFNLLTKSLTSETVASQMKNELGEAFNHWQKRLNEQSASPQEIQALMRQYNPVVIPRNHHVEGAIQECEATGKVTMVEELLQVLRSPYEESTLTSRYQDPPGNCDEGYKTFCGT